MDARADALPRSPRPLRRAERRRLDALDHSSRLEALGERLATTGPIPVRDSRARRSGGRHLIWLDDGTLLDLRLFWPKQCVVASVFGVRFHDDIGWLVDARTTAGDAVRLTAWLARCHPPALSDAGR